MTKPLILFDWDDTLFSKTEYKKGLRGNLARICEASEEEIFEVEERYFNNLEKSGDFRIDTFIQTFEEKFGKKIQLEDFSSDNLKIYSGALFPETISVLNNLKNQFNLGIYSQGFIPLQKIKIKSSGVGDFFDEKFVFIDRDKIATEFLAKLPDKAIIVEDKKEVVEKLKNLNRFKVIWINRINDEKIPGIKTIKSLLEITE